MTVTRAAQGGEIEGLKFERVWPMLQLMGWCEGVGAFDEQLFVPPARPGRRAAPDGGLTMESVLRFISESEEMQEKLALAQSAWDGWEDPSALLGLGEDEDEDEAEACPSVRSPPLSASKGAAAARPAAAEPAEAEPAEARLAAPRPKPAAAKPKPVAAKPKPAAAKPAAPKPAAPKPAAPKPAARKPDAPKPDAPKPAARKPDAPKPAAPEPATPLEEPVGAPTGASSSPASRSAVEDRTASDKLAASPPSRPGSALGKRPRHVEPSGGASSSTSSSSSNKVFRLAETGQVRPRPDNLPDGAQWTDRLERLVGKLGGWGVLEGREVLEGSNSLQAHNGKRRSAAPGGAEGAACSGAGAQCSGAGGQERAQYGRANAALVTACLDKAKVGQEDLFMDIGSGIGSVVLQAAAMTGCKAVGIELLEPRHRASQRLKRAHDEEQITDTQLQLGDFSHPTFAESITRSTVLFVNNARGTFAERCVKAGNTTLDSHVARLCRLTQEGTRIITMDRLRDLETAEMKDVFKMETFISPKRPASWTESKINFHLYTKKRDFWICSHCTLKNPLTDFDGLPLDVCNGCQEDPRGMQRAHYSQRERNARAVRDPTAAPASAARATPAASRY
jgi:hypothetical protein